MRDGKCYLPSNCSSEAQLGPGWTSVQLDLNGSVSVKERTNLACSRNTLRSVDGQNLVIRKDNVSVASKRHTEVLLEVVGINLRIVERVIALCVL
jgi:hypothetical protein